MPKSYSPAKEMRLRVLDGLTPNTSVDKYGLNAYIYDSRNDHKTRYDRVLFSTTKSGSDSVGNLEEGEWADVKVTLNTTDALNGKTGAFLVKVERLDSDLSHVRLFHTSVTRAIATWNGWSERGFTGTFEDFVAERFPSSQAGDFAVLEAGIVSEETYIEQGEYWEKSYHPLIKYVIDKHKPDLAMVGYPVTDEVQHQFLGLVTRKLPNGANNPSYDDVNLDGKRDDRVKARERFIREAYEGSDETMRLAQDRMRDKDLTTFVGSDHGFAPQFLAIDASKVLVDLGLLKLPQISNCRIQTVAQGETIGKAKACYAGGAVQIYLNVSGRDPAIPGMARQVGAPASTNPPLPAEESEASVVARVKAAFQTLTDTNDWTHDGQPEGWKVIDRVYTKAEARYIPNGANSTADMAHPTRTGDVVAFSYPPYQFDAATPGTLIAPSAFFGQHGYVPDVQDLRSNTNMRATFLAGGDRIDRGVAKNVRSIDLAPTAAFLLGVPAPQHSQGVVRRDIIDDGDDFTPVNIIGLNDFHGQLAAGRDDARRQHGRPGRRRRAARDDVRRGGGEAARPVAAAGGGRQRRRVAAGLGAAGGHPGDRRGERVGARRHELRQPRVRLRDRADPQAPGAGELPVPGHQRRRDRDRPGAGVDEDLAGLPRQRRPGRRDRLGRAQHA